MNEPPEEESPLNHYHLIFIAQQEIDDLQFAGDLIQKRQQVTKPLSALFLLLLVLKTHDHMKHLCQLMTTPKPSTFMILLSSKYPSKRTLIFMDMS